MGFAGQLAHLWPQRNSRHEIASIHGHTLGDLRGRDRLFLSTRLILCRCLRNPAFELVAIRKRRQCRGVSQRKRRRAIVVSEAGICACQCTLGQSRDEDYTYVASVECISDTDPPGPSSISGLHMSRELGNGLVLL